ncbi:hypothetical protein CspeluHIS016_0307220 [Cutaneotrichosporon spelunceum]|uniref:Uncharacterized protein n=1 Tax=Cutaneotrichosporon spelunceum TaxID=1672016 RepID=A0AAD3TU11_9TREE|nr:hypothetical protein CspeluHIS016_0307220 [Cutaneotrichosporon spelunceum]
MGLFSTSTVEREEKLLQKEQKNDEKAIKLALKDLDRAHKAQRKAEKAEHDAAEDHQKAIRREEKLAAELLKLQHEHESAIVTKDTLANEVAAKQEELNRLGGEVTRFQDSLEKAQERARQNGQRREKRLAELGVAVTSPTASSSADPLLVAERREVPAGAGPANSGAGAAQLEA